MRMRQELPISIVMVVRNEERVLEDKLRNLLSLDYPAERCQIVVVSDGSTDRTEEILREHAGQSAGSSGHEPTVVRQSKRAERCIRIGSRRHGGFYRCAAED